MGWSGMSSSSGAAGGGKEWLEVDPGVGEGFGWKDGMEVGTLSSLFLPFLQRTDLKLLGFQVEISIIHSLTPAKSISVAPLTPEDWEIIVRSSRLFPFSLCLPFADLLYLLCP